MGIINQHQRAALCWDELIKVAKGNNLIQYGQLGKKIGIHHRAIRFVLGIIVDYCYHNKLPLLTILVVNKKSGLPGKGFISWYTDDIEKGQNNVYGYNWSNLENPFSYAKGGLSEDNIIKELLDNPDNAKDTYSKIKDRGVAQSIFRKALLRAYNNKCAFCSFSFELGLQASHIIPWSKAKKAEKLDVRNGILLCATHHLLFDYHWLTISNDYTICFNDPQEKERIYSEYDSLLTSAINDKKMNLPIDKKHKPKAIYLTKHRKEFNKKQ